MEERYINYFSNQLQQRGSGLVDIGKLYKTNRVYQNGFGELTPVQRGDGLASLIRNFYQLAYPLIKSGFSALGTEAKTAGKNILRDITTKPITDLIKQHGTEAFTNLKDKVNEEMKKKNMHGKGIKKQKKKKINKLHQRQVGGFEKKKKSIKNKVKQLNHQSVLKPQLAKQVVAQKKNLKERIKKKQPPRILDIFD